MSALIKTLSVLLAGVGVIWLNIKSVGIAAVWAANYFGRIDDLQAINKPLQAFYSRLLEMDQSALIVEYGPWGLSIGGASLFVLIVIWQYFRRLLKGGLPESLAQACEQLAREIALFMNQRQSQEPQHSTDDLTDITEDDLNRQFAEETIYSNRTKVLYEERITPRLNDLYSLLIKNKHKPGEMLTFGDESWANRKIGKLTSYARILRQGGKIRDERRGQGSLLEQG